MTPLPPNITITAAAASKAFFQYGGDAGREVVVTVPLSANVLDRRHGVARPVGRSVYLSAAVPDVSYYGLGRAPAPVTCIQDARYGHRAPCREPNAVRTR